jgi:aminoglycoside phosphotransferase (APT) family kinase protein
VLLQGDLQTAHILVDPQTEKVLAFLDFADAQPGDPLVDLAVVTLWDQQLTDFLLEGYSGIAKTEETQRLLALYRLLHHLLKSRGYLSGDFKPWLNEILLL